MANIKKHSGKKALAKKTALRGKDKVFVTYDCGCYSEPIVTVDACGCVETQYCY